MNTLPQELLRKNAIKAHERTEPTRKNSAQGKSFRDCFRTRGDKEHKEESIEAEWSPLGVQPGMGCAPTSCADAGIQPIEESKSLARISLPADMEALFEKTASCMIVMSSSHEMETTLTLEGAQFASSLLQGTQITVREFSSAPKIFNIEIISNPQGAALIDAGKTGLLLAFGQGAFPFSVNRLDVHLTREHDRPVFQRKEDSDSGSQDHKEGRHS